MTQKANTVSNTLTTYAVTFVYREKRQDKRERETETETDHRLKQYLQDIKTQTEDNHVLPWQRFRTSRRIRTLWRSSPVWAAWGTNSAGHTYCPIERLELVSHC